MLVRLAVVIVLMDAALVLGYPLSYLATHGLNPDGWPSVVDADGLRLHGAVRPGDWLAALHHGNIRLIALTYFDMFEGQSPMLTGGGLPAFKTTFGSAVAVIIALLAVLRNTERRHYTARFGKARWATRRERSRLNRGLEIGFDPETRRPIRVAVEGNLLTIAPPRTGKTSAFILPNLAAVDHRAWHGSTVVIDPKGDAYRAAGRRRAALGRSVRCLDPYEIIGGPDRWNPLQDVDPDDVARLQSIATMLLPGIANANPSEQYFHESAAGIIVAALQCAIRSGHPDPAAAAVLVRDTAALEAALRGHSDAVSQNARQLLQADSKTRDPVLATVRTAFGWALDPRAQRSVQCATFRFEEVCRGTTDLFIVTPADRRSEALAPYLRWLLGDLFETIRTNRPNERIVIFIDEAFILGRYDAILRGVGELPGYGVTLWTIWQSRAQIAETYGESGAKILLQTAEVVSLFNLSQATPDETDYWSSALGNWTAVKARNAMTGEPDEPVAQALVPSSDLPALTQHNVIAFITNRLNTTYPILCRKRFAHQSWRLRRLLDLNVVRPVGAIRRRWLLRRP